MQTNTPQTLASHLDELRSRLMLTLGAVLAATAIGFALHQHLLALLQKPLGLDLYYTSPAGGFMVALNVSILFGLLLSVPVIIYQLAKFISPAMPHLSGSRILAFVLWSVDLALAGVMFAYFVSFPSALAFLYDFAPETVSALITVDEYIRFAVIYIGGFALMFQLPLLILLINSGRPMPPRKLLKSQKYIVLGSFIAAALITPTPDPINQMMLALPPILLFYTSVLIIAFQNWRTARREKRALRSRAAARTVSHTPVAEPVPSAARQIEVVAVDEEPYRFEPSLKPSTITPRLILDIRPQT